MSYTTAAEKAERALAEFRRELAGMPPEAMDLMAIERWALELAKAWGRATLAEAMKRADTEAPEVVIDGERWGNRRMRNGTYATEFGDVEIERSTYQKSGRGRVAIPVDLRLGIVEGGYTPRMARIMSKAVALMPEGDAEDFLSEVGLATVSKSTLHRIPRAMAARYETRREVVEAAIREQDPTPCATATIQVSLDGVMVPQDGEYARPRGRKTDSPEPARHEKRYGPPSDDEPPADSDQEFGRAWHEASVGTIAYFDAEGNRLKTTYLARMPEPRKATLVAQLERELQSVIGELPAVNLVFASDGAAAQWNSLTAMRKRLPDSFCGNRMMLVDFYHAAEYVQAAANAIHGEGTADAKIAATQWDEMMKHREDGVLSILKAMRYQRDKMPRGKARKQLVGAIKFLAKQHRRGRMKYPEAQRRNYPIGTGVTEAAAKTVVNVRMKRAGARFSQHGGQTVMLFRTAILSERFDLLHDELRATYMAQIAA
jgi:hypothetical protein